MPRACAIFELSPKLAENHFVLLILRMSEDPCPFIVPQDFQTERFSTCPGARDKVDEKTLKF